MSYRYTATFHSRPPNEEAEKRRLAEEDEAQKKIVLEQLKLLTAPKEDVSIE